MDGYAFEGRFTNIVPVGLTPLGLRVDLDFTGTITEGPLTGATLWEQISSCFARTGLVRSTRGSASPEAIAWRRRCSLSATSCHRSRCRRYRCYSAPIFSGPTSTFPCTARRSSRPQARSGRPLRRPSMGQAAARSI